MSATHFGCSTARNKGPTVCTNLRTVRQDRLEASVLDGLRHRLMDPGLYAVFASEFTAAWNKHQAAQSADLDARKDELARVRSQLERLVDAICNGTPPGLVNDKIRVLEDRRAVLDEELATAVAPAPRLHPNLAVIYREKVAVLADALNTETAFGARDLVRSLVEEIRLVPEGEDLRIELRGELSSILGLAGSGHGKSPVAVAFGAEVIAEQVKLVAGTGFEPVTFRL